MFEAGEAGETGAGAEQLSVCTLQAGSVCSVETEEGRRVSALSSVPLHAALCVCVCVRECRRAGGWGKGSRTRTSLDRWGILTINKPDVPASISRHLSTCISAKLHKTVVSFM